MVLVTVILHRAKNIAVVVVAVTNLPAKISIATRIVTKTATEAVVVAVKVKTRVRKAAAVAAILVVGLYFNCYVHSNFNFNGC